MKTAAFRAISTAAVFIAACGDETTPDTCTGGDTMTDPRIELPFDATSPSPELLVAWDPGMGAAAMLPDDYFQQVELAPETSSDVAALISDITYRPPRQFSVRFDGLGGYLESNEAITFGLSLPDRENYTECTHPGIGDRYLVSLALRFDSGAQLLDATFDQQVVLGGF